VADAYGSVPREGMLEGNRVSLGHFNSCMEVEDPNGSFSGSYCNVIAKFNPPADEGPEKKLQPQGIAKPLLPSGIGSLNVSVLTWYRFGDYYL